MAKRAPLHTRYCFCSGGTLFQANIPHLIDVLLAVFMGSGEPWVFMHPTSPQAEMDGSKAQTHWNQRASLGLWKFLFWLVDFYGFSQLSYIISCAGNRMESKVWKASFWMRSYLAPSMKRTLILTNQQILTRLATEAVTPQRAECQPTTRRYKDKNGKTRYVGTSTLKSSQNLTVFEQMVLLKVLCSPPKTLTVYFHMLLLQVGDLHLRIYTGRFAKAVMTLYPGVVQSPPLWPQEVSRQSIKTREALQTISGPKSMVLFNPS